MAPRAGTTLVKDIDPASAEVQRFQLKGVGNTLFLSASDGVHGNELWKSDGTEAGTVLVKDINPGAADSYPGDFAEVDGQLYFGASDGIHGEELWKSDGTEAGTLLVADIIPGANTSTPSVVGLPTAPCWCGPTTASMATSYGGAMAPQPALCW